MSNNAEVRRTVIGGFGENVVNERNDSVAWRVVNPFSGSDYSTHYTGLFLDLQIRMEELFNKLPETDFSLQPLNLPHEINEFFNLDQDSELEVTAKIVPVRASVNEVIFDNHGYIHYPHYKGVNLRYQDEATTLIYTNKMNLTPEYFPKIISVQKVDEHGGHVSSGSLRISTGQGKRFMEIGRRVLEACEQTQKQIGFMATIKKTFGVA